MFLLYLKKGDSGPQEEDLAAVIPIDEHDTIQQGKLMGNVDRTEDELLIPMMGWKDDEGSDTPVVPVDITQKVPLPLTDASGKTKRLWIVRDKGHLDAVSASTLVSEKIPKRWDLPLIDPRRLFRHLEGPRTGVGLGSYLSTRMGMLAGAGLITVGMMVAFFLITASGHLR